MQKIDHMLLILFCSFLATSHTVSLLEKPYVEKYNVSSCFDNATNQDPKAANYCLIMKRLINKLTVLDASDRFEGKPAAMHEPYELTCQDIDHIINGYVSTKICCNPVTKQCNPDHNNLCLDYHKQLKAVIDEFQNKS